MASRRKLKKNIGCIITELITECLIRSQFVPGTDKEAADGIICQLISTSADFTARISHTEPGCAKKYYKTLYEDFNTRIGNIIGQIEALSPKQA